VLLFFPWKNLTIFPGLSEGGEIDMPARRSGPELERIFYLKRL
jgi:hypothetical protein